MSEPWTEERVRELIRRLDSLARLKSEIDGLDGKAPPRYLDTLEGQAADALSSLLARVKELEHEIANLKHAAAMAKKLREL